MPEKGTSPTRCLLSENRSAPIVVLFRALVAMHRIAWIHHENKKEQSHEATLDQRRVGRTLDALVQGTRLDRRQQDRSHLLGAACLLKYF